MKWPAAKKGKFIHSQRNGRRCRNIDWKALLSTFAENRHEKMWTSLFACHEWFRTCAKAAAERHGYAYPDYDEAVAGRTLKIYRPPA